MAPKSGSRPAACPRPRALAACALLLLLALAAPLGAGAEGSATLYPGNTISAYRANIEWRTSVYGSADSPEFNLYRRTLLKVYAEAGETLLLGSSAIDVPGTPDDGDVRVFVPGAVTGPIGGEEIPALAPLASAPPGVFANGFSCAAQRAAPGNGERGRIASRDQELAGPNVENAQAPGQGYTPCTYRVPATGIYDVVFTGPSGPDSDDEPSLSGTITPSAADFGPRQRTSVTAWDVSVRRDPTQPAVETGRAFTYYVAGNTGGGGRNVVSNGVVVTDYGFRYRVTYNGDPYGFIVYSNQFGFRNTDGTPLYHNIMADAEAPTQDQNQLKELQGGVELLPPRYPIFFDDPYPPVLDALTIPRAPIIPSIASLAFTGSQGDNTTLVGKGGTFTFQTSQPGVFTVVISRDGVDFTPDNPRNKLLLGFVEEPGPITVSWDGRDNGGEVFPVGEYRGRATVQGGEVHFPFLDVENNTLGGPRIELLAPPDADSDGLGDCPPWEGGCFGAFYNDSGYRAAAGELVGTSVGGPLCPGNAANPRGFGNPPEQIKSDSVRGYDTRTTQRAFGFPLDANPAAICLPDGGFGDKKALDLWTFYPSNRLVVPLRIIDQPTAVTLLGFSASAGDDGVTVRWQTGAELNTVGFHLLRAPADADRAAAVRVTPSLILARGSVAQGAAYSWVDSTARRGENYRYWLEEHEAGGRVVEYGPVSTAPATAAGPHRVSLPLVR
jgi:hypothetical protein